MTGLEADIASTLSAVTGHMDALRVHDAMATSMDLARTANGYVDRREPWSQAKDPSGAEDLDETLASLAPGACRPDRPVLARDAAKNDGPRGPVGLEVGADSRPSPLHITRGSQGREGRTSLPSNGPIGDGASGALDTLRRPRISSRLHQQYVMTGLRRFALDGPTFRPAIRTSPIMTNQRWTLLL